MLKSASVRYAVKFGLRYGKNDLDLTLKELEELMIEVLGNHQVDVRGVEEKEYWRLKERALIGVFAAGLLSNAVCSLEDNAKGPLPVDWADSSGIPSGNFALQLLLRQISNHGNLIVCLIERGLTNSAQIIFRTLFESILLVICLAWDREMMHRYAETRISEREQKVWRLHFNSRVLLDTVGVFEEKLGITHDDRVKLWNQRKDKLRFYSGSVHSSMLNTMVFSHDFSRGISVDFKSSLWGSAGKRQEILFEELCGSFLFLFNRFINATRMNGSLSSMKENESWSIFQAAMSAFVASSFKKSDLSKEKMDFVNALLEE